MRLVLCCGVFDLFHAAHVAHLKEARSFGDNLVVALTLDEYVGKRGRPIIPWQQRADILMDCRSVDDVFASRSAAEAIMEWKPNVYVKGSDYLEKGLLPAEKAACDIVGAQIRFTKPNPITTTSIIERVKQCA